MRFEAALRNRESEGKPSRRKSQSNGLIGEFCWECKNKQEKESASSGGSLE
jgi:hypothetical protein